MKDEDTYERITKGYLPTASIVFLDEIWKAGPAIQNSLLTVINEKIYRNGQFTVRVPLKALIAASNELPAKGEGLEALYDRFLIRQFVGCIEQEYAFDQMISSTREVEPEIPAKLQVDDELYNQIQAESEKVGIHYTIFELIHNIKHPSDLYIRPPLEKNSRSAPHLGLSERISGNSLLRLLADECLSVG